MASIGAMSKARATPAASARPGSTMSTEKHLGDLLPARTHRSGVKRSRRGKQNRPHLRREVWVAEYLFKVVDEMRATDRTNPLDLRRTRALEEYSLHRDSITNARKESPTRHPI